MAVLYDAVTQWIACQFSKLKVAGSSPASVLLTLSELRDHVFY